MKPNPLLPKLGFVLDSFLLDGQTRNLRKKTLDNYRWQLTRFLRFAQDSGCTDLCDITAHTIRSYLVYLSTDLNWAPASVHSAARPAKTFLRFCVQDELLTESPMVRVKMPANEQPAKIPLSQEDVKRLLARTTNQRDKAMVLCLLDSGCRVSEFTEWNIGDVDLSTGAVHLRRTKNREPRTVFLGAISRRELAKHYRGLRSTGATDPVWVDPRNERRMKPNGVNQALRRIGRSADVWPCNPHRFRHTFAVSYLRNGGDIFTLQRLLGHKSLEMVRRYLALTVADLQDAHGKWGVVDNLW